jgi:hypothetical protein
VLWFLENADALTFKSIETAADTPRSDLYELPILSIWIPRLSGGVS